MTTASTQRERLAARDRATPRQVALGMALDQLVEDFYRDSESAMAEDNTADAAWALLVRHAEEGLDRPALADQAEAAYAMVTELGGTWADGDLFRTCAEGQTAGRAELCVWLTLEQMGERTGLGLPQRS
ncbi:hypothetical protein [Ornithinicoccus halotolerans]|uniref:hypothetical protein n=1 Tax=Ornithinicoccus halotolerans TaxID=1748220 RepID=UPI001296F213|nr:hypothetical protein [Ornithinicoccus halotolerans]